MPLGLAERKDILECIKRNVPEARAIVIGISTDCNMLSFTSIKSMDDLRTFVDALREVCTTEYLDSTDERPQ